MPGFRIGFVVFPFIFILGFAGVFAYRYIQVQRTSEFIPTESTFSLEPPKSAVTGTLKLTNGEVLQKTRIAEDFGEATAGGSILQGESIATKKGSASLVFEDIGSLFVGNNTEVAAVNLVPQENVFQQKSGTIQYESGLLYPISVRALHALCEINGSTTISILGASITVRVTSGSAKLALVDTNNNTKVWNLSEGQLATINDSTRRVSVR